MQHLQQLKLKIRKYQPGIIFEFDSLDELRQFDSSYKTDSQSLILKEVSRQLHCTEEDITHVQAFKDTNLAAAGFTFEVDHIPYQYHYTEKKCRRA